MTAVGTRIAVAKQCNYKVWCHVIASINNSNSAVPMAVITLRFKAAVGIPDKKHKDTTVFSFGFQPHVDKHFLRRLLVLLPGGRINNEARNANKAKAYQENFILKQEHAEE